MKISHYPLTILAVLALVLVSKLAFAAAEPCNNSSDGKIAVQEGRLICKLGIQKPLQGQIGQLIQSITVNADVNYAVIDLFSQLSATPDQVALPRPQSVVVTLIISGQKLPINLDVNPRYMVSSSGTVCDLKISDFVIGVSNLKSQYLPTWLAKGLENYLNKEPKVKKEAIAKGQEALPKIKASFHCK